MEPLEIKHALERAGFTQIDIARQCEVSPTMVYLVVRDRTVSAKVRHAISRAINRPVVEIWPACAMKKACNG